MFRIIFYFLIAGLLLFIGVFLLFFSSGEQGSPDLGFSDSDLYVPAGNYSGQQAIVPVEPGSITSFSEEVFSAEGLLTDDLTTKVTSEGFYDNTTDSSFYHITYYEPTGSIVIQLYKEPLSLARRLAEGQLSELLPYSESQFCDMNIKVNVHKAVAPLYANQNLGLSFCPGAVNL